MWALPYLSGVVVTVLQVALTKRCRKRSHALGGRYLRFQCGSNLAAPSNQLCYSRRVQEDLTGTSTRNGGTQPNDLLNKSWDSARRRDPMPIELQYRDGGAGVVFVCTGIVTAPDFYEANEQTCPEERVDLLRYQLVDKLFRSAHWESRLSWRWPFAQRSS